MAVGDTGADSARGWRERVRGGTKELRGEVARLGARGIEARRREVAGIGTGAASGVQLGLLGALLARGRRGTGRRKRARLRADKDGSVCTMGEVRRRDAWRLQRRGRRGTDHPGRHSNRI